MSVHAVGEAQSNEAEKVEKALAKERMLQSIDEVLDGRFSYSMKVPQHSHGLMLWLDAQRHDAHTPSSAMKGPGKTKNNKKNTNKKSKKGDAHVVAAAGHGAAGISVTAAAATAEVTDTADVECDDQTSTTALAAVEVAALNGADLRLRAGLPLLVPIATRAAVVAAEEGSTELASDEFTAMRMPEPVWLRLNYSYVGPQGCHLPPYVDHAVAPI
jgi:hypothetical protein